MVGGHDDDHDDEGGGDHDVEGEKWLTEVVTLEEVLTCAGRHDSEMRAGLQMALSQGQVRLPGEKYRLGSPQ